MVIDKENKNKQLVRLALAEHKKNIPRRNTSQRIKILTCLRSVKTHPTAEMVYSLVRKELPSVSLATIYRNLHLLADSGEILRLEVNGEYRFDGDVGFHQHCVCKECGKIIDLFQKELSTHALNEINTSNFIANNVNIVFLGSCISCIG